MLSPVANKIYNDVILCLEQKDYSSAKEYYETRIRGKKYEKEVMGKIEELYSLDFVNYVPSEEKKINTVNLNQGVYQKKRSLDEILGSRKARTPKRYKPISAELENYAMYEALREIKGISKRNGNRELLSVMLRREYELLPPEDKEIFEEVKQYFIDENS